MRGDVRTGPVAAGSVGRADGDMFLALDVPADVFERFETFYGSKNHQTDRSQSSGLLTPKPGFLRTCV